MFDIMIKHDIGVDCTFEPQVAVEALNRDTVAAIGGVGQIESYRPTIPKRVGYG